MSLEFNKYHTRTKTTDEAVFLRVTDKAVCLRVTDKAVFLRVTDKASATPTSNLYHCLNSIVID